MSTEAKRIPEVGRTYNLEEYAFVYNHKKKDVAVNAILLVAMLVGMIAVTISYILMNGGFASETFSMIVVLAASAIFIALFFTFTVMTLTRKPKNLDNGEKLYFIEEDKKDYVVVENFSGASVSVTEVSNTENRQLVDQFGNEIYYAEEIFDDEEDIFVNEVNSTAIAKEKETTYSEIISEIDETLLSYGLKGEIGKGLLASMSFSPIIYAQDIKNHIKTIFKAFDNPEFFLHYSSNTNIAGEKALSSAFDYAKTNPDKPIFIYIDEIPSKEFLNYMRPLYPYIDNPLDDYYIITNGMTMYIPHNIYFLITLKEGDVIYDISRRYLRYIGVLKTNVSEVDIKEDRKPYALSNKSIKSARRNAAENYALDEYNYKKLDNLFNLLNSANGYVLQNKIQRKIEEYSSLLLSLGGKEDMVLDECLAQTIIPSAIITSEPQKLANDFNVVRLLESEFGADNMKQTKGVVKEYISLFGASKGGKK